MARLFFALQPDSMAREALATLATDLVSRFGGRAVPALKIHLTLVFLGEVEAGGIDRARGAAQGVAARAFVLSMDRVGGFARQSLAWVAPGAVPPELAMLHDSLAARLREAGFTLEKRRFSPHVTVARRIECPVAPAQVAPIAWSAVEFALVESDLATGSYRHVACWALAPSNEEHRASN